MTWQDALEIVVARTGHQRYRALCDHSHPDHGGYRELVLTLAGQPPPRPRSATIPLAGDAIAALAGRLGIAWAVSWLAARLGTECGCNSRQARLNRADQAFRHWLRRRFCR
jgi:hypothetical protein